MACKTPAATLADELKSEARRLGFDALGVAPAVPPPGYPRFLEWLGRGHAAGMTYLEASAGLRADPSRLLDGLRTIVIGMMVYGDPASDPAPDSPGSGRIARYARGDDYHELLWRRLEALLAWLQERMPGVQGRAIADSAPLLERDFARLAGLGWIGKNTMLIARGLGSYTVLGALLLDVDLEPDLPFEADHCGTCTRCLDACPTQAFAGPYELDARRCISYWTVEHRGTIPGPIAESLEGWVFGCDIRQEVCPWNRKAPPARLPQLQPTPERTDPDLIAWLEADPTAFRNALRGTALERARRSGLLRNAALVLGTRRVAEAIPALIEALDDSDPVVRDAAAWALARFDETAVSP